MKVLSLLQRGQHQLLSVRRKLKTRSWNTKYRGLLLIHASQGKNKTNSDIMLDFQTEFFNLQLPHYKNLPFGAIIGKVFLVCPLESRYFFLDNEFGIDSEWVMTKQELAFGDYTPGRYGWLLSDPVQFEKPTPAKGQLSLWDFDESLFISI